MGEPKRVDDLFEGRHFHRDVIVLCVRWYLRFKLSLRDLVEMMAERGLSMAHTTIMQPQRTRLPPMASVRLMLRKLCQHTL
jgi:transposase-like protein